jgi:hypothetical protein
LNTNNKTEGNHRTLEENNKYASAETLDAKKDSSSRKTFIKSPFLVVNGQEVLPNENVSSTLIDSNNIQNVISSVPKLPSISIVSTDALQSSQKSDKNSTPHIKNNEQMTPEVTGDEVISRKKLELLELNIKSVEEQTSSQNGKRQSRRPNGVNRYNHLSWTHYHDDQDAIFVVDA